MLMVGRRDCERSGHFRFELGKSRIGTLVSLDEKVPVDSNVVSLAASIIEKVALPLLGVLVGWHLRERSEEKRWQREVVGKRQALGSGLRLEILLLVQYLDASPPESYREEPRGTGRNFCPIFDSNTERLGLLGTDALKEVVVFYATAKDYFDLIRDLQRLWEKWRRGEITPMELQSFHGNIKERRSFVLEKARAALKCLEEYQDARAPDSAAPTRQERATSRS